MRPKTRLSGIFNTKRSRAVSVSRLTRMFVPNPKKAFQSPGTQSWGFAFISSSFLSACMANGEDSSPDERRRRCEEILQGGNLQGGWKGTSTGRALDFSLAQL